MSIPFKGSSFKIFGQKPTLYHFVETVHIQGFRGPMPIKEEKLAIPSTLPTVWASTSLSSMSLLMINAVETNKTQTVQGWARIWLGVN